MEKLVVEFLTALKTQPLSIITIVAASAAVLSAISAWRSSRAARENLRMAKIDFEEKHDSIRANLVDSVTWELPSGERMAAFACTYSNAANAPNTIVRVELYIYALSADGTAVNVVLDPQFNTTQAHRNIPQLQLPLNLGARSTASGWISFTLPKHIQDTKRIDKYQVVASTSTGKTLILDSHILQKINK